MTCPHCHHLFPLTWGRYVSSPLGKHVCPSCGRMSKFRMTVFYLAFIVVTWVALTSLAIGLGLFVFPKWRQAIGFIYIVGCIALIPLDKFLDEKFRRLEKLGD